jgi:nucleotide-binding universal stress UspA family protein
MNTSETVHGARATLIREYEISGAPAGVHGITFAASRLVVASGAYLLRLVPDTGRLVDRLETFPVSGGLAYDGRYLWQHAEGRFQQLDARTGFQTRAVATELDHVTGLACLERDLLILHSSGRRIARVQVVDHALSVEAIVAAQAETEVPLAGLTWAGGELWSSTEGALVRIDPTTARVLDRVALPAATATVRDLAADVEGRLWCVDGTSRVLRAFASPASREEPATLPPIREGGTGRTPEGMRPSAGTGRVVDVSSVPGAARPRTDGESPATAGGATFARVLVPIDFSEDSKRALATALVLQDSVDAEVHLFHFAEEGANDEFLAGIGAGSVSPQQLARDAGDRIRTYVDDLFPGRAAAVKVHAHTGTDVVHAIEHAAREVDATLVILSGKPRSRSLFRTHIEKIAKDLNGAVMVLGAERGPAAS